MPFSKSKSFTKSVTHIEVSPLAIIDYGKVSIATDSYDEMWSKAMFHTDEEYRRMFLEELLCSYSEGLPFQLIHKYSYSIASTVRDDEGESIELLKKYINIYGVHYDEKKKMGFVEYSVTDSDGLKDKFKISGELRLWFMYVKHLNDADGCNRSSFYVIPSSK